MTPQEKQAQRAARQAEKATRQAQSAARQAERAAKQAAREEKIAAREEKKAEMDQKRDERAGRDLQKCVQNALPAAIRQMRDDCIKNPGGPSCKAMLDGNYPVCAPVSQLRGKPPTKAEIDCNNAYLDCKENLLPKAISQQAAACAANPGGQDCKDIAAKRYPRCASCGE